MIWGDWLRARAYERAKLWPPPIGPEPLPNPMSRYICPIGYFETRSFVDLSKCIVRKRNIPNNVVASASSTNDEVH